MPTLFCPNSLRIVSVTTLETTLRTGSSSSLSALQSTHGTAARGPCTGQHCTGLTPRAGQRLPPPRSEGHQLYVVEPCWAPQEGSPLAGRQVSCTAGLQKGSSSKAKLCHRVIAEDTDQRVTTVPCESTRHPCILPGLGDSSMAPGLLQHSGPLAAMALRPQSTKHGHKTQRKSTGQC